MSLQLKKAVIVKWLKPRWLESFEINDLARAAKYDIVDEIVFRSDKPQRENFIPEQKLEALQESIKDLQDVTLLIDGDIRPHQIAHLEKLTGADVIDKIMLVLKIFQEKASTREIQLQVELANLEYTLPKLNPLVSENIQSEKQARDRGSGEQIKDIVRSNTNMRKATLRKKLNALKQQHHSSRTVQQIPIVGFYSVGKSTLFNILCATQQDVNQEAFTTMFLKTARSTVLSFPIDFIDTVGLVDLPNNVLNAFNNLFEPIFQADIFIVTLDGSVLRQQWEEQLAHIRDIFERNLESVFDVKLIFVHTKYDLAEPEEIAHRNMLLQQEDWLPMYRSMHFSKYNPEEFLQEFREVYYELAWNMIKEFSLERISPSVMSKIYDIAEVTATQWNEDGTCTLHGRTSIQLYGKIEQLLQQ